ncbi:MAG: ABC transporter substrate-binding protein [Planctomycetota bacterium]
MPNRSPHRWNPLDTLSIGGWLVLIIAVISSVAVAVASFTDEKPEGLELWTFAANHGDLYQRLMREHNQTAAQRGEQPVHVFNLDGAALNRRTISGFLSGTPLADLIEVERTAMGQFFAGRLEDVGFTDLTEHIEQEGLLEQINPPSFTPWTSRGRIFGLPHDVHPVLLAYRADLVEDAGIDVSQIETWDDFVRVMSPLIADTDGDGTIDRYLINLWYTNFDEIDPLLLQAGGGTFDEQDNSLVASDANAMVIAHAVAWNLGHTRIAIDAPEFNPSGNLLKLEGKVVAQIMPDWLAGVWKRNLPALGGKIKLMPLPAWEPGGLRTSVKGGTMIGIPKSTEDFEAAWEMAKRLYLDPRLAQEMFEASNIISPVTALWDESYYHKPDPFFMDQPSGTLFIEQAPHVPFRSSNPFHGRARTLIGIAVSELYDEARAGDIVPLDQLTPEALIPRAKELLEEADARLQGEMDRNVFLRREREERAAAAAPPTTDGADR